MPDCQSQDALSSEIAELEAKLARARLRLQASSHTNALAGKEESPATSLIHSLLWLADSALPLGSFAYSNGLESFLAHHKNLPRNFDTFCKFFDLSIDSLASTNIPYVLEAYRRPLRLAQLANDFDASTTCTVARRSSVAQGRALLNVWEMTPLSSCPQGVSSNAATVLHAFGLNLKVESTKSQTDRLQAHFAPLWGVVCSALSLEERDSAYVFLFNHAKALASAAVRASVIGPYQAQRFLASYDIQRLFQAILLQMYSVPPEDAGQSTPSMDIWMGRHELLYSRIFNS